MSNVGHPNKLRAKLAQGETVVGLSCALGSAQIAEEFAMAGMDFIYIDQQHGLTSHDTLIEMLRAISRSETTPLVRVAGNDASLIGIALDAGAEGVIVPMINTADQARSAAQACRYHPRGTRSWGPIRSRYGLGSDPDTVNREVLCLVMIETKEGLDNLQEILDVSGVDGVYIGPADLGVSLGGLPLSFEQSNDPLHLQSISHIRQLCAENNRIVGISGNPNRLAAEGFTMITAGLDVGLLREAISEVKRTAIITSVTSGHPVTARI